MTDAIDTIDLGRYYVILPSVSDKHNREEYIQHHNAVVVKVSIIVLTKILNGKLWSLCVKTYVNL